MSQPLTAFKIFCDSHDLGDKFKESYLGNFYNNYPLCARCVCITGAVVRGLVTPLIFIIQCLVNAVILPIIGAIRACQGKKDACSWINAGVLNFLGAACAASFFIVSAYYLPLAASAGVYIGATVFVLSVYMYRASEAPQLDERERTGTVIKKS